MRKRILIADDDSNILMIMFRHCTPKYQVTAVATGKELHALLSACNNHYDLVISDIMMPGLQGTTAIELAKVFGYKGPVLFVTGYPGCTNESDHVIEKPFDRETLIQKVEELLSEGVCK